MSRILWAASGTMGVSRGWSRSVGWLWVMTTPLMSNGSRSERGLGVADCQREVELSRFTEVVRDHLENVDTVAFVLRGSPGEYFPTTSTTAER